ncbi:zinc uptake protein ZrgA [Pseudooceanicola sp. C21-150M6]|uniref:zinc uptake protein ZrgA n=1 Tax=Pseudooceanicola sp. C21-150M6 TaxID=3434355 RepID=UPI003D7F9B6C
MKPILLALAATSLAAPALAQETREMEAHVHGVSKAEIAVEHGKVEINILSPGMDIVGFEYEATSEADKDAVETAIRALLIPENVVTLPAAAGCRLAEVLAHLHGGDHDHDDADAHMDGDHDHEEHAGEGHDHDHDHDEDHAEDDHDHEGHADDAQHSEFHVSYAFACEDEDALTTIAFPFFDQFENAQEIEAQYVTETGAGQAEITRAAPELTLE